MSDPAEDSPKAERRWLRPVVAITVLALVTAAFVTFLVVGRGEGGSPVAPKDAGSATPSRPEAPSLTPRAGAGSLDAPGLVVDASGAPVVGVAVSAELELGPGGDGAAPAGGLDMNPTVVAITDAEGRFQLRGLEAGRYRIEVAGPGIFTSEVRFVEVPSAGLSLIVAREVSIRGVLSDAGAPVPDVEVALSGIDGVWRARTDSAGRFGFESLPEGVYRAWAAAGERAAPARRVDRMGAGPFDDVVLEMGPAHIVRGRVVDQAGDGVIAAVRLSAVAGDEPPRYARSAAGGQFVVEGVPAGRWNAEAFAPGYIAEESITFEPGAAFTPRIALRAGAALAGRVTSAEGVPVEGAVISLRRDGAIVATAAEFEQRAARFTGARREGKGERFVAKGELGVLLGPIPFPPPAGVAGVRLAEIVDGGDAVAADPLPVRPELESRFVTDADGRYRVTGLAAGSYRVVAAHRDFADGRSAEVAVSPAGALASVDIVMHPGVMVTGTVRDETGAVIVGATVIADVTGDEHARLQGVSGTDGVYTLGPIAVDVTLRATAVAHGDVVRALTLSLGPKRTERREDFVLARANAVLAGRVSDASGFPVRGATVSVAPRDRGGIPRVATTDAHGRFELAGLAAGEYPLAVEHPGFPRASQKARTGETIQVSLAFGGGVGLELRDAHTRAAIVGALVVATGPDKIESRGTTGEEGELELAPLLAGRWTVRANAPGYAGGQLTVDVAAGDKPGAITAAGVKLELERGATLAGVVRDGNGDRVAGAVVSAGAVRGRTDQHGAFRLRDVATGRVSVRAKKGSLAGSDELDLSPGDERVTLELTIRD